MIQVEGLRFAYPDGQDILKGCGLHVRAGEVVAVAGPNGSGKTTLLKLAAGLLRPGAGSVRLGGRPVSQWERIQRAKRAAYVPQNPVLPEDWPVDELLAMGDYPHREAPPAPRALGARLAEARDAMDLAAFWRRRAGTLSGGEAQRVALGRALVQCTPALLLDEPASHLDLGHQMALFGLLAALARSGKAVLLTTHDPNLSRLFGQRLLLLDAGGALQPMPDAPVEQEPLLREVFGVPFLPIAVSDVTCWFPDVGRFRGERSSGPTSRKANEECDDKKGDER